MFDKSYISSKNARNTKLKTMFIKTSPQRIFDTVKKYVQDNGFKNIQLFPDYYEIFCVSGNFEYTFIIVNALNGSSTLRIQAYTEFLWGGAKKQVAKLTSELIEIFKDVII